MRLSLLIAAASRFRAKIKIKWTRISEIKMWRLKIVKKYFIIEILISIFHTVKIILSFLGFKFVLKSKFLLALRPYLKSSFLFSQLKMAAIHETDAKIIHDSDFNRY